VAGRVLVTGADGFTGPHVRAALERRGYQVSGISRFEPKRASDAKLDLLDAAALRAHIKAIRPEYVVHLAAITFVAHEDAAEIYRVNLLGSLHLLEALAGAGTPLKKVILASSANVYGRPARMPVEESAPPAPVSHYGVSKYAMELMAARWFGVLPILLVRPFNYTGAGQDPKFVLPKIVEHFRRRAPQIELGDTSVVREFMDVRDVGEAYAGLLESDAAAEAVNLCSGVGHRLDAVLATLQEITGFAPAIARSAALMRGNEIPQLVGSNARLMRLCPQLAFRPLRETLSWMLG
jgi:GDP-6-deoxy-D-talose 4-dehydrogenase